MGARVPNLKHVTFEVSALCSGVAIVRDVEIDITGGELRQHAYFTWRRSTEGGRATGHSFGSKAAQAEAD